MPTSGLIESFAQFAREQITQRGENLSIDELFDEWRILNPPPEDWSAVRDSLRDMETGETGRPFEEFAADFRLRNGIREAR